MHKFARFLDPRNTIEGKIVTAILLVVLVFSMANLSAIVENASATGSNDNASNKTETELSVNEGAAGQTEDGAGSYADANTVNKPMVITALDQENGKEDVESQSSVAGGDSSKVNPSEVTVGDPEGKTPEGDSPDQNTLVAQSDEPIDSAIGSQNEFTIAMVNSNEYATLQEAINAANDGDTITLCLDSAQNLTIENKKDLTLDLNGHTITKTDNGSNTGEATVLTVKNSNVNFVGDGLITGAKTKITTVSEVSINGGPIQKRMSTKNVDANQKYRVISATNSNLVFNGPDVTSAIQQYSLYESEDKTYGGVVFVKDGNLTIEKGKFEGGSKSTSGILYGATVAVKQGDFVMTGGAITGPGIYRTTGLSYGGSLYVAGKPDGSSVAKIMGGVIDNTKKGKKTSYGGNIALSKCAAEIGGDVKIQDGYASNGGNVYMSNGSLKVTGGTIAKGTATQKGGGIYAAGNYANSISVKIAGGVISNNSVASTASGNGGGGVYAQYATLLDMTGGSIEGNTTKSKNGAGIYLDLVEKVNLTKGAISNNTADNVESSGGGVYIKANSKPLEFKVSNAVVGNSAGYGAGIAVENSKNVAFDLSNDARIYNNTAINASNVITGTSRNKADELLFKNANNVSFKLNGEVVEDYADHSFEVDVNKYTYKMTKNGAQVSYYCDEEKNITRDMCIEGIILDPNHNENHPQHYVWNEEEGKAYPATIETDAKVAISKARETGKPLIVCSQATLADGEISGVTIERCEANKIGSLFVLSGDVAIKDAVVDGKDIAANSSMLYAKSGANVAIESGAIIKNANRSEAGGGYTGGAALEMAYGQTSSALTIDGATFENNKNTSSNGGAIWAWHTNATIKEGTFSNNIASNGANAEGGFLCVIGGSNLSIEGGSFDSNSSSGQGGAISLLRATNTAVTKGSITGGEFTNNVSARPIAGYYYGGGAVYNDYDCELEIYNAIITGNTESSHGDLCHKGAIANCRSGSIEVYKYEGMLAYGNQTSSWEDNNADIAFCGPTCPHFGDVQHAGFVTVSDYALGGGDCNWTRFDGTEADRSYYQNTQSAFKINSHPSQEAIAWANEHAKVRFEKNHALGAGSAIMNNGKLTFGGDKKNLRVTKEWLELDDRGNKISSTEKPASVTVQLAQKVGDDVVPVEESTRKDAVRILNEENGWEAYWADLGSQFNWTIVEVNVPGYDSELSQPSEDEVDGIPRTNYTLTNTWNDERTNISTEKIWQDSDNLYQIRPESIEVKLAIDVDGNGVLSEEELKADTTKIVNIKPNEEGVWRWEFADLPKYTKKGEEIKYLVSESPVEGYKGDLKPVQATDAQGGLLVDNEGDPVYTWKDADGKEWSAYNLINSLDLVDLAFQKNYEGWTYKDANGNGSSTAVFRVMGAFNGNEFYNNIVSADFVGEGSQQIELKQLLVGATYTIQELEFDGSGYVVVGNPQTFMLTQEYLDNLAENNVVATFNNNSRNEETPNQGVINRYTFSQNGTNVEQIRQQQAA